jgi:radical SAM protein with 4Fe4S-binding SPASM domain
VLIDGSISACPNINRSFAQGNIYQDDFLDVWNNRFEIMRNRSWSKVGKCANCKDFKRCNGGAMHLWDEKREDILCCLQN